MNNPLAIVTWDRSGNRTIHTWSTHDDLAWAYWAEQSEWAQWQDDENRPATPAMDFVDEIVTCHAPDAFDTIQALLRAAPTVEAVEFVGASALENLLTDPRTNEGLFLRVEQAIAHDARAVLALSNVWVGASVDNDFQRGRLLALGARDLSTGPAPGSSASD